MPSSTHIHTPTTGFTDPATTTDKSTEERTKILTNPVICDELMDLPSGIRPHTTPEPPKQKPKRFEAEESVVLSSLPEEEARLHSAVIQDAFLQPVECQTINPAASFHKLQTLPHSAKTNSAVYDRLRNISNAPSTSKIQVFGHPDSPSARLPTSTLTGDVPACAEEPPAAVDVDHHTSPASINMFPSKNKPNSINLSTTPAQPNINGPEHHLHTSSSNESISESSSTCTHKPRKSMLFFQWNIRGLWSNHPELCHLVLQNPPIAISLQEMMTRNIDQALRKQYTWDSVNRHYSQGSGATGLGILSEVPHKFVQVQCTIPVCVARLLNPYNITVVSIYVPPNSQDSHIIDALNSIKNITEPPYIIGGDFNAAHEAWGSIKSSSRGLRLLNWIVDNSMVVLNNGEPTFISSSHGSTSSIDLTIVSKSIANRLYWSIAKDTHGSDHFPISVFTQETNSNTEHRRNWLYKNANWSLFEDNILKILHPNQDYTIDQLNEAIIKSAEISIPKTSGKRFGRAELWWTDEVKRMVKTRRSALRKLKRTMVSDPNYESIRKSFITARSAARKTIAQAKYDSWVSFCSTFNPRTPADVLWSNFNKLCGKRRKGIRGFVIDGTFVQDPSTITDTFAKHFQQASAIPANPNTSTIDEEHEGVPPKETNCNLDEDFTIDELLRAIDSARGFSTGKDNVGYPMIRHLPISGKYAMLKCFNRVWADGKFPQQWREGVVVPIQKPGTPQNIIENYRPITLLSCIGKIYERMVNHRLVTFLEANHILHPNQHAFRPGRGTSSYFAELKEILDNAKQSKTHLEFALLDIKKAYDQTWRPHILQQLNRLNVGKHIKSCISEFLQDRRFSVSYGGALSSQRTQDSGVPQGSVLAVTLFLLAMNTVFEAVPKNIQILVYADDIVLISSSKQQSTVRKRLINAVNAVNSWAKGIHFSLSAPKSCLLHVCQRGNHRGARSLPPIVIERETIPEVNAARFLGVWINRRGQFSTHAAKTKQVLSNRLNFIRALSPKASRSSLWKIANAVCMSKLTYGVELFGNEITSLLKPTYNELLRISSGAFRTSPILSLAAEAGELPFDFRLAELFVRKYCRIVEKNNKDYPHFHCAVDRVLNELIGVQIPDVAKLQRIGRRPWNFSRTKVDWSIKKAFKKGQNPKIARALTQNRLDTQYQKHTKFFTDGSKTLREVGVGIIGPNIVVERSLLPQCGIFTAEAAGLLFAARLAPKTCTVIFSDSASCISAVEKGESTHPFVQEFEKVAAEKNLVVCWIPSHTGISGNEQADQAAERGRSGRLFRRTVPASDIAQWIKQQFRIKFQEDWDKNQGIFLRRCKPIIEKWSDRENRQEQKLLTRLRIGHTKVTKEHLFNNNGSPNCDVCKSELTVKHILINCKKFDLVRDELHLSNNLQILLGNTKENESKLLKFLKKCNLSDKI